MLPPITGMLYVHENKQKSASSFLNCLIYVFFVVSITSPHALRYKDRLKRVIILCVVWVLFSLGGSLYVLHQMSLVNDLYLDYEDVRMGWILVGSVCLGGVPLVAVGCNLITWTLYARWVTKGGSTIQSLDGVGLPVSKNNQEEEAATRYQCLV